MGIAYVRTGGVALHAFALLPHDHVMPLKETRKTVFKKMVNERSSSGEIELACDVARQVVPA
jgi:hypothetical protein